ncbi:DEAD/DEAH box helicase [Acidipila sp. EB88]|uniref:Lhr family helicase n=1 Tax=Acidipila sp. EB88 TaxID=2305226 RepID=UPI000F5F038C|nr:DEAD/DEAH box helicase [Acidipila sp. EB88]RRA48749.1 DEAD/DEAH box helicase [Acidipila sp. EB88]
MKTTKPKDALPNTITIADAPVAAPTPAEEAEAALRLFHPVTADWFRAVFERPTSPQRLGWPAIARGESTLILAPTGTGKTLTAFLWCLDRIMLSSVPPAETAPPAAKPKRKPRESGGCRVIYISPLKALAVDVERNLRSPLAGIANMARQRGVPVHLPEISIRTGDTSQKDRARFRRHPGEILITTPESLYLLLTSDSAASLKTVETVIIDEIHALVPTKRGAHMALSLERLEAITREATGKPLQRIGLSATQRPLEEVAHFLAGTQPREVLAELPLPPAEAAEDLRQESEREWTSEAEVVADELAAPQAARQPSRETTPAEIAETAARYRPVTIINASEPKRLELKIEVPVEDMAKLGEVQELPSGAASQGPKRTSIWSAIHPRLLEIVRQRTSTLIFVNSRRIAERLAGALNELAEENIARAHHGSLAAPQRSEIEELLKAGKIKALVATSSLELGIDMGAVDLVIQIEAPPSVASGMQRIGRAGHSVGAASEGIIFPKYRADLVACAAVTRAMHDGLVESTRFLRNPLDVLAQQMVAIVAQPPSLALRDEESKRTRKLKAEFDEDRSPGLHVEELYAIVRACAPYADLSRGAFEGVLDLLAGRYPSDEFAELRPRVTWDRVSGIVTPRQGAKGLAILNGGTIPDRGLYGVFLSGSEKKPIRVGELDEEMVFESRTGDTFILGASTWRIDEITHDKVLVSPAPGEPGKMPFWHGDNAGRPLEFGRRIGALVRELRAQPHNVALTRLVREHDLEPKAAENLLRYLADQEMATSVVPDDRTIVIERVRDELGDWRVCVLTPFGSRVHAPWAMAVTGRIRASGGPDVEVMWADDGFVLRFPESDVAPDADMLLLDAEEATAHVLRQLGATALFAAKFRESAARALLLPRKRATGRAPLWQQRKRAYDLLAVASRYASFPMLLEAYRECMRDVFDMPAFLETLRAVEKRQIRVHVADTRTPSPFASSLLFSYVANYIYDGDAPLAERRAQALSIDQEQLRELMGDADLRELLDPEAIAEVEETLQSLGEMGHARSMDAMHDLLLRLGDLTREELRRRTTSAEVFDTLDRLLRARRVLEVRVAGEKRLIAVEDAARYRDALGIPLPPGLPTALLAAVAAPVLELLRRYARTHGPFTLAEAQTRFALDAQITEATLRQLLLDGRIVEGGFRPGGIHREWCDAEVLRLIRRKSLARLRKEVEPVEQQMLARLGTHWQGILQKRYGLDALLDTIEQLQGAPLVASLLETSILPARVVRYMPGDLDTLIAAGEVAWCGLDALGEHDGRVALYLAEMLPTLRAPRPADAAPLSEREEQLVAQLGRSGAMFFSQLHDAVGGGYPGETLDALWSLVWRGIVSNDTFHALRAYVQKTAATTRNPKRQHNQPSSFRSRRTTPASAQGRWTLLPPPDLQAHGTEWSHALTQQLLNRYGVLTRESVASENVPGGFSAVYDVLKAMEESGKIRRGYFVAGLGATQFALPAAVDLLRSLRSGAQNDEAEFVTIAATDPANPYGSVLRWPAPEETEEQDASAGRTLTRSAGASVVMRNGELLAYMRRGNPHVQFFLPADEPERSQAARDLAAHLASSTQQEMRSGSEAQQRGGLLLATINGQPTHLHWMARILQDTGFQAAPMGFNVRRVLPSVASSPASGRGNISGGVH